ncbi:MAG: ATP-binding protein [Elusimicrobiota bacterium]|jgi:signal transduction histidine kinase
MGTEIYDSVVSKLALVTPMFAQFIMREALKKHGGDPQDISPVKMKRIIAEEVLPRLRKYVKNVDSLESLGGGEIIFSKTRELVFLNPAVRLLAGIGKAAPLQDPRGGALIDRLGLREALDILFKPDAGVFVREVALENPKARLNIIGGPIRDGGNNIEGAIFFLQDVTLRRALEEDVERYEKALEERAQALQRAYEELKETQAKLVQSSKMASLGTLAGGVAHEINNPLTGVLSNAQIMRALLEKKGGAAPEELIPILQDIEDSAKRCTSITRALLDFSHPSKGRKQDVSLNETSLKVMDLIGHELRLQNIHIREDFAQDLPQVLADPQLIQQVILNLLTNARWAIRKKSGDKGGEISLRTKHDPARKEVVLTVSDDGIGIPPENLAKILEPFFTTKDIGEGTGLGLSLDYSIVRQHGGTIEIESPPGQGATFRVRLPSSPNPAS